MREPLVVCSKKARQRFLDWLVDAGGGHDAFHECGRAAPDHAGNMVVAERSRAVRREHRVGAVGEVAARVDERAVEIEHG